MAYCSSCLQQRAIDCSLFENKTILENCCEKKQIILNGKVVDIRKKLSPVPLSGLACVVSSSAQLTISSFSAARRALVLVLLQHTYTMLALNYDVLKCIKNSSWFLAELTCLLIRSIVYVSCDGLLATSYY